MQHALIGCISIKILGFSTESERDKVSHKKPSKPGSNVSLKANLVYYLFSNLLKNFVLEIRASLNHFYFIFVDLKLFMSNEPCLSKFVFNKLM